MKYTEDNIQGVRFYTTDPKKVYILDLEKKWNRDKTENGDVVLRSWSKSECMRLLNEGVSWHVLEPVSNQVINNYQIY